MTALSAETRAKISAAHRGKKLTPEHCAAIAAGNKGKTLNAEARKKISDKAKARWQRWGVQSDAQRRAIKNAATKARAKRTGRTGRTQRALKMRAPASALTQSFCDACGTCDPGVCGKNFSLDHDHNTGLFRGVLCRFCNTTLGGAEKRSERFALLGGGLLDYARKHGLCSL